MDLFQNLFKNPDNKSKPKSQKHFQQNKLSVDEKAIQKYPFTLNNHTYVHLPSCSLLQRASMKTHSLTEFLFPSNQPREFQTRNRKLGTSNIPIGLFSMLVPIFWSSIAKENHMRWSAQAKVWSAWRLSLSALKRSNLFFGPKKEWGA